MRACVFACVRACVCVCVCVCVCIYIDLELIQQNYQCSEHETGKINEIVEQMPQGQNIVRYKTNKTIMRFWPSRQRLQNTLTASLLRGKTPPLTSMLI